MKCRETLAAQAEHFSWLGARLNLHLHLSVERRHFNRTAESCRGHVDEQIVNEIVVLTDEVLVLFDLDEYLYISGHSIADSCVTLAGHVEHHAILHTSRYLHFDDFLARDNARATAEVTFIFDDSAFALAIGTDALRLHHTEDGALGTQDITRSVARRTRLSVATSVLRTAAVAMVASDFLLNFEFFGDARSALLQR